MAGGNRSGDKHNGGAWTCEQSRHNSGGRATSKRPAASPGQPLYSCFSEIAKSTTVGSPAFTFTFFAQLAGELYIGRFTSTCAPTSSTRASDRICQPSCQATISYSPGGTSESL